MCSRGHPVEKVNTNKNLHITSLQLRSGPYWSILERINTRVEISKRMKGRR